MKQPVYDPLWPDEVQILYRHDMEQTWDPSLTPHMFNQYRHLLEIYQSFAPSDRSLRILDVGCAQATLDLLLAEAGHHVVALDIRQPFLDYAASRYEKGDIRFVAGNVFDTELGKEFDLIYVNQIIEHVVRPVELMKKISSWLVRGGRAVVSTPNCDYIKSNLGSFSSLGPAEEYAHLEHTADGDGHFFAYTPAEMHSVFQAAGFADVAVRCFETPWISGHMKFRYLHRVFPYGLLRWFDSAFERLPWLGSRLSHQMLITGRCAR